jgi:RNA polymerase sigma factor (sigma-70 family)
LCKPSLTILRLFKNNTKSNTELHQLTDEQLVERYARTHDTACLGPLFERYTHLVFAVSMKYLGNDAEAEDMVMTVFEKLFEELKRQDIKLFKSWLYTVTKNQCLMYLRHEKSVERNRQEILKVLESEVMENENGEHLVQGTGEDGTGMLEDAIGKLNEAQRRCIELFYLEERSYKDVAETTGFSMNEVKSHLQNGRRNLKIFLENAREQ